MRWDHPSPYLWCTRNGRTIIERAFYRPGFEIRRSVSNRRYRWVQDNENEVRLFKTLIEAKGFVRRELLQGEAA